MTKKETKPTYKKGMTLVHRESKKKILFGQFQEDGSAVCFDHNKQFITLTKETLDTMYVSYTKLEKDAQKKRRYQAW